MHSLGIITINALACADTVLITGAGFIFTGKRLAAVNKDNRKSKKTD